MNDLALKKKWLDQNFSDFSELLLPRNGIATDIEKKIYQHLMRKFSDFYSKKEMSSALAVGSMSTYEIEELTKKINKVTIHNIYGACFSEVLSKGIASTIDLSFGSPEIVDSYKNVDIILSINTLNFFDCSKSVVNAMAESLNPGGYLCLAVQNAKSASRHLAKTLGYIEDFNVLTPQELSWRQRRTMDLDGLKKHVLDAGLRLTVSGGAFFKLHTLGQLNQLIDSGQADEAYIDSLFDLGEAYPELCQTVYVVAKKVK